MFGQPKLGDPGAEEDRLRAMKIACTQVRWPSAAPLPRESAQAVPIIRATPVVAAVAAQPEAAEIRTTDISQASVLGIGSANVPTGSGRIAAPVMNGVERSVSSKIVPRKVEVGSPLATGSAVAPVEFRGTADQIRRRSASPIPRGSVDMQPRLLSIGSSASPMGVARSPGSLQAPMAVPRDSPPAAPVRAVQASVMAVMPPAGYPGAAPSSPLIAPRLTTSGSVTREAQLLSPPSTLQTGPDSPAISTRSRDIAGGLDNEVVSLRSTLASREAQIQELELLLSRSNAALQEREATIDALTSGKMVLERSPASPPRRKTLDPPQRQQSATKAPSRNVRPSGDSETIASTPARSPSVGANDRSTSPGTRKTVGSAAKRNQRIVSQERAPKQAVVLEKFETNDSNGSEGLRLEAGMLVDIVSVSGPWAVVRTQTGQSGEVPAMCLNMEAPLPQQKAAPAKRPQRMVSADRAANKVPGDVPRSPIPAVASTEGLSDRRSLKSEEGLSDRRSLKSEAEIDGDEIDHKIREYLEDRQIHGLEFNRMRKSWYTVQPTGKKVFCKLAGKDKVIVRVGGGYASLHKFVEEYLIPVLQAEEAEAERLQQPIP